MPSGYIPLDIAFPKSVGLSQKLLEYAGKPSKISGFFYIEPLIMGNANVPEINHLTGANAKTLVKLPLITGTLNKGCREGTRK